MTRGRKKAEVVGEPSRARESSELADENVSSKYSFTTNTQRRFSFFFLVKWTQSLTVYPTAQGYLSYKHDSSAFFADTRRSGERY